MARRVIELLHSRGSERNGGDRESPTLARMAQKQLCGTWHKRTPAMAADYREVFIQSIDHWSGVKVERAAEGEIKVLPQKFPELLKALEGKNNAGG